MPNDDYIERSDAIAKMSELPFLDEELDIPYAEKVIMKIPAADVVEEENILKFYYVRSIDEYWIGQRVDRFYYAEYDSKIGQWVWTHSRYLPWGEHIVSTTSLWKEHTYPSKPEEIPFADWLQGFIKKHIADDVEPVRHGRWIPGNAAYSEYHEGHLIARYYDRWTCSVCNYVINDQHYSQILYKRCPECGAKMDEEEDDGNEL